MESESVNCCITSPPYWALRDYGVAGQIGLENTPESYVAKMVEVFREVRRLLKKDGTLWLNLGDSYLSTGGAGWQGKNSQRENRRHTQRNLQSRIARETRSSSFGLKNKDLCGIPWRVALALQADGWYLRSDIIWHKPNPMPESVLDRPSKSHEYIFLFSKAERYYYDADSIREESKYPEGPNSPNSIKSPYGQGFSRQSAKEARDKIRREGLSEGMKSYAKWCNPKGRNKRTVWEVPTFGFSEAHFATFPPKLIEPCVLAGCQRGGTILDPFFGAGTTGLVALKHAREFIGIELNPEYVRLAEKRLKRESTTPTMFDMKNFKTV